MSELSNPRYETGSMPVSKANGFGGVDPQPQTETGAEISAPTTSTKIKTMPQPDESVGSSKIKTLSPALVKAMNAKKGFAAPVGKRIQATYPLQKPPKNKFVRVHPSPEYRMNGVLTLTDLDTGEIYYVSPDLDLPEFIASQTRVTDLYAAQMSDGSMFIWPLHRSETSWYRAAKAAIRVAVSKWVAVVARRAANTYDLVEPEDSIPEPEWSSLPSFAEMLESAFEDHMVTSLDHPFLRKLRGFREDGDDD
jgi:hypothetical protein